PTGRGHRRPGAPGPAASTGPRGSKPGAGNSNGTTTGHSTSGGHVAASQSPAPSGATAPATGTYSLAVSGSEHVKFGPFSACTNTFPSSSSLVVHEATGEAAGSYDFDQRFYPNSANKHDERHIYRYSTDSVVLSYEQATVTCAGMKQSTTV